MKTGIRRRELLQGLGVAIAGGAGAGYVSGQQTGSNWRTYGYDTKNTGYNPEADNPTNEIEREWRFAASGSIISSPAVVNNAVYVSASGGQLYVITPDTGDIQTYSLGAGEQSDGTSSDLPDAIASSPTVQDGVTFVGTLDGTIHAINTRSQERLWSFNTDGVIRSSPTVLNETLFIGSSNGTIFAIDIVSGDSRWEFETGGAVIATPAVRNNTVVCADDAGTIYGIDIVTGDEQWQFNADSAIYASPAIGSGRVFVATRGGQLIAIGRDGTEAWSRSLNSEVTASPALTAEQVFVGTRTGEVTALGRDSGSLQWSESGLGQIRSGVSAGEGALYAGDANGTVRALDSEDGSVLWSFSVDSPIAGSPILTGQRVIIGTEGGTVFSLVEPSGLLYTAEQTARTGIETFGQELVGLGVGSSAVLGGYVGVKKLRGYMNRGKDATSDGEPEPTPGNSPSTSNVAPIAKEYDRPAEQQYPTLEDVQYDDFEIQDRIGSGGNADVHKATITYGETELTVALKTPRMSDYKTVDTDFFEDFVAEAEVWESIDDHRNIVPVLGWGTAPHPWIALQYMEAGNLDEQIDTIEQDDIFLHLEELCEGIHHAHRQGITHTDLKPENILFTTSEGKRVAKIADWGLANVLLEHSTSVQGLTPAYAAPEQIDPEKYGGTDDRTDIYQLGAVAYELFTGTLPFERESYSATMNAVLNEPPAPPTEFDSSLPEQLDDVLLRVLSKRKNERYETVLHFRDALRSVYHGSI